MKRQIKKNFNRELRGRRVRARVFGTAQRPRFSVFRSNRYTYAQLINDTEGRTLVSASTQELGKKGLPAGKAGLPAGRQAKKTVLAEELGKLIAEKAKKSGFKTAVFDRSFYKYHGRVKAVAESARSAGLKL